MQAAERAQRLFQYALRTLLALRRSRSPVVVSSPIQPKLTAGPQEDASPDTPKEEGTT
jgi:hypothetical protein